MTAKQVWLDGYVVLIDPKTNEKYIIPNQNGAIVDRKTISQGSAVEIRPGLFLTAGHIFTGPFNGPAGIDAHPGVPDYGSFQVNPTIIDSDDVLSRNVSGGYSMSNVNLYGYSVVNHLKTGIGTDFASFQAKSQGGNSGLIVFNSAPDISKLNKLFKSFSYTGFPQYTASDVPGTPAEAAVANGTALSADQTFYSGSTPSGGGVGTIQISGTSLPGQSGTGIIGTANGTDTTYTLGTLQGNLPTSPASISVNYINQAEAHALFSNYILPSGASAPRNIVIGASDGNDEIGSANSAENIITYGSGNKILASSYGGIVNPGNGLGNEVFIPADDVGTTILATPGSTTIVGGSSKDQLAVLSDRLWHSSTGAPSDSTTSNSSSIIPLMGGVYNSQTDNGPIPQYSSFFSTESVAGQEGSTDPVSWEIGDYDLTASYHFTGSDLQISVVAHDPSTSSDPIMWVSNIDLVDYQPGEFGLTFKPQTETTPDWSDPDGTALRRETALMNDHLSMMGTPQGQTDLNDDASSVWSYNSIQPINWASNTDLSSDQTMLEHLYDTTGSVNGAPSVNTNGYANLQTGTAGNDDIIINASDMITNAETGDDTITHGPQFGNETYLYASGDGNDVIDAETATGRSDTIAFSNLTAKDIALSRSGTDLLITDENTNEIITVKNQWFDNSQTHGISSITLSDGFKLTSTGIDAQVSGSSNSENGNNAYYSSYYGDMVKIFNSPLGTLYSLASGLDTSEPSSVELESLKAMVDSGASDLDVAQKLIDANSLSSMSATDFVSALYEKMLGRTADTGGLNYYASSIQNGTSRSEIALEFAVSSERSSVLAAKFQQGVYFPDQAASEIARLYYAAFERAPDLPNLKYYTDQLSASGNLAPIADSLLNSTEGTGIYGGTSDKDFVNTAFINTFGRPADAGASDYYSSQLAQGETRGTVLSILVNSSEGISFRAPQIEQITGQA